MSETASAGEGRGQRREAERGSASRLSLRANFSWITLGRGLFAVCQWGMLAVLAKLTAAEVVGQFTLALAIGAPIFKLANLGLRHVQATDVRDEYAFGDYLGLRHATNLLALLAVAGVALYSDSRPETVLVIVLVGLTKALAATSEVFYARFQLCERMDHVARSLMLRGPLSLAALAAGAGLAGSLPLGVAAWVLCSTLVLLLYDLPRGRRCLPAGTRVRPRADAATLARLAWQALPLGLAAMLVSLALNVPRYFVADQLGLEALGYFAAMLYVLVAANQFMMALGHAASARLARLYAQGQARRFARLLARLAALGLLLGLLGLAGVAAFGPTLLRLLYTDAYAAHAGVFTLVMGAALIRYVASLLQFGVTAARRFRIQVLHHSLVTLAALAASACLIAPYGLTGAALVTLITASVDLLGILAINVWSIRQLRPRSAPIGFADPGR